MKLSLPLLKKLALVVVGLVVVVLFFLWQALPRIIQSQMEKFVAEKTSHRLVMDRPEFNPFQLALRIDNLQLNDPDGKPLFSFDGLLVDISSASITKRALVFDVIRLERPSATIVELPEGKLNWTPFLDALKSKEEKPEEKKGLPRLNIRSFVLSNGKVDYADRRLTQAPEVFSTTVEPLDLELTDLSTLPDDEGKLRIAARTTLGAKIELFGKVDLNPIMVAGTFSLSDLQLAKLAPYLKNVLPVPPEGVIEAFATYNAGNSGDKLDVTIEQIAAKLTGLCVAFKDAGGPVASADSIEIKDGRFQLAKQDLAIGAIAVNGSKLALPQVADPPQFGALTVDNIHVILADRNATVGKVKLADASVAFNRNASGGIDLQEAFKSLVNDVPAAEKTKPPSPAQKAATWRYKVDQVEISNLGVTLKDTGVNPPLEVALDNIALIAEGVSHDLNAPVPFKLTFDVHSGGHFVSEGKAVPAVPAFDASFSLNDLALNLAQPFLTEKTTLTLTGGKLTTQGRAIYNDKGPNVKGEFLVNDLSLTEPGSNKPLLAWKTFGSRALTLTQNQLDLGDLQLSGLDMQLIIDKDKNINFKKVQKTPPAPQSEQPAEPSVSPEPTFIVNIDSLRFSKGEMDFADQSLIFPFATRIHDLHGNITGLSNRTDSVGQVKLDGAVDKYGMARAVGSVKLGDLTDALNMRVQFRNVEMTRLTPYIATYAGRKINSGKLSLDLQYKIKQRQLQGKNQVIMNKLTLGERVESQSAKDLPLDLAIAILQDSNGRIDLNLPVSGNLDDPQFSFGAIIWKAITNLLTKIVTAPFRMLGSLLGGEEKFDVIVFEAGTPQLTPPEREKVARLADAMGKRPGLVLAIGGLYSEADRVAMKDVQLRRALLARAGQHVPEKADPGTVAMQDPKMHNALEALYKERFGRGALAALKDGFRSANPGELQESATGKMMSRITGLFYKKKTLSADEVAQLKGGDFYEILYERLRAKEPVADDRLVALAQTRGDAVIDQLKTAGVPAQRIKALPPEKYKAPEDATSTDIPLNMKLESAKSATQ